MRRVPAYVFAVGAALVGIGVGLWMALASNLLPQCPVRGLGTADLCAAQPAFSPGLCALCGAAAAAVILLLSVPLTRRGSRAATLDAGAALAGVTLGLWASMITYTYPPCGPHLLCIIFLAHRFAAWQSALVGLGATIAILVVGGAMHPNFRRENVDSARMLKHWLFRDLSSTSPVGDSGTDAQ
jgi:hypothetical protein